MRTGKVVVVISVLEHLLCTHRRASYLLSRVLLPASQDAGDTALPVVQMSQRRLSEGT